MSIYQYMKPISLTSLVFGFIVYIITIILQMIRSMHDHSLCHPSKSQLKQSGNDNYYQWCMTKDLFEAEIPNLMQLACMM